MRVFALGFCHRRLVLALGDEAGGVAQHLALVAEDRQRLVGARQQVAHPLLGAVDAELGDEGGLAERRVGAGRLAERFGIAFDVEQVVGDLERLAERAAVIVERLILLRGRLRREVAPAMQPNRSSAPVFICCSLATSTGSRSPNRPSPARSSIWPPTMPPIPEARASARVNSSRTLASA